MDVRIIIARLLEEHDCVILPGYGGFIGNYAPARIDAVSHSFIPPSKKILFNINLKQNDGLLCNRLVTDGGVSYADALALVNGLVTGIRHTVKSGKSFIIPEVGRLFAGREGTLQFEQAKDFNLLPDAFGLQTFTSPPVNRTSYSARFEKVIAPRERDISAPKRQFPLSLKWAAMLAIPIGAAAIIGITQYDKLRNPSVNNAGILSSVFTRFSASSLDEKKDAPARGPEVNYDFGAIPSVLNEPEPASVPATEPTSLPTSVPATVPATIPAAKPSGEPKKDITVDAESETEDRISVNKTDGFAIIIGVFKVRENAEKCIQEAGSRGLVAGIFDRSRTGMYRVALTTAGKQSEADNLLSEARSKGFSGAWLLVK